MPVLLLFGFAYRVRVIGASACPFVCNSGIPSVRGLHNGPADLVLAHSLRVRTDIQVFFGTLAIKGTNVVRLEMGGRTTK